MLRGRMNIVIGAQAGSEAKGKLSGYLVDKFRPEIVAGSLAPNAGHTIIKDGNKYISHHIPVCSVISDALIVMGPTSVINPVVFKEELNKLGIDRSRLRISSRATIITQSMVTDEKRSMTVIGSTAQGVGLARAAKLMRGVTSDVLYFGDLPDHWLEDLGISGDQIIDDAGEFITNCMKDGAAVLYEMSQGFDLCMEHGIDRKYCTSRIINPAMALAEMGVGINYLGDVYGVLRPYPIRVNNRDGYSGPYGEAAEITWEEIAKRSGYDGDLTEITTTTKLPRRVFEFSWTRFEKFIRICRPDYLCLQFANYLDYSIYGTTSIDRVLESERVSDFMASMDEKMNQDAEIMYIGTGPGHTHMVDCLKLERDR